MSDNDRYTKPHTWGNVTFELEYFVPQQDECQFLLMKVVEQSVRDYINLEHSTIPIEQQYHTTATGFIFDDDYRIDCGGLIMSFEDVLSTLNSEVDWFRQKVRRLKETKKRSKRKKKR